MSLSARILNYIDEATGPVKLADLYTRLGALQHSIRARLHEARKAGQIVAIAAGVYIGAAAHVGAQGDARQEMARLAEIGAQFDFIVLDLPWECASTKGGNRHISDFPTITAEEFGQIAADAAKLLRTETSAAMFIFSAGHTAAPTRRKYQAQIEAALKPAGGGAYHKTYANGQPCKIGRYELPAEDVILYTRSGRLSQATAQIDVTAVRPNRYPTQKPVELLTAWLSAACPQGGIVLDPFGGSGSTAAAADQLGMASLSIDILHDPVSYLIG